MDKDICYICKKPLVDEDKHHYKGNDIHLLCCPECDYPPLAFFKKLSGNDQLSILSFALEGIKRRFLVGTPNYDHSFELARKLADLIEKE
jgi:hypothetical protein